MDWISGIAAIFVCILTSSITLSKKIDPLKSTRTNLLKTQPNAKLQGANIPGIPGVDYPILASVPKTQFLCGLVQPGFYADPHAGCQVWHYCDMDGRQDSFLCPNGTLFNQVVLTCDWWYKVDCADAVRAYLINGDLYRPPPITLNLPTSTSDIKQVSNN